MPTQTANKLLKQSSALQCQLIETEDLLKQLVERVERNGDPDQTRVLRRTPEILEEIVYEAEVDGIQYLLVRSQIQTANQGSLSPRELAIARLVAKGLPNKTIGTILEISPWTVATHLRRVFTKLDVTSRAAMVAKLVDEGVL